MNSQLERDDMNELASFKRTARRLSVHRLVLLASAAGLAIALVAGNGDLNLLATPANAATGSQAPASFADVVAQVKPAVISVRVEIDGASMDESQENGATPIEPGAPLEKFFRRFGQGGVPQGMQQGKQTVTGQGSGFFVSADGYAVTNNHVVDHAKTVQIKTDNGTVYKAKVVGTDVKTDLALIKVDADKSFPYVKFAEDDPRVGDWVVAVGNPFGLGGTVTAGIVSARGRDIGSGPYDDYVQIDAPINKGNSGGPAFNMDGQVIGVNTAIFSPSGGSVGIGFDIPANTAKTVVAQLMEHGSVDRAWLGVQVQPVTAEIADSLGLQAAQGAIVDEPQAGSPAAKAGIVSGDVITAIDGVPVKDSRDLARKIGMTGPGTSVKLSLRHKGEAKTVTVLLAETPDARQAKADAGSDAATNGVPHLGLTLAPKKDDVGANNPGVAVVDVDPNGPAAERGVKIGDIILDVGGNTVANVADVKKALTDAQAAGKKSVLMRVKTADATHFVALPIA